MKLKSLAATAVFAAAVPCASAAAQIQSPIASETSITTPEPEGAPPAPEASCCVVPALTTVELEFVDPASSRSSKTGERIALRLAEPLVIDSHVVAPAGSPAFAEVVQASKGRMLGKAGELTLAARYVEVGSVRIPLKRFGYGRSQGSDPTGTLNTLNVAAAAAAPIASIALIFVSGGNVDIQAGARAHAVVAADTIVASNP